MAILTPKELQDLMNDLDQKKQDLEHAINELNYQYQLRVYLDKAENKVFEEKDTAIKNEMTTKGIDWSSIISEV